MKKRLQVPPLDLRGDFMSPRIRVNTPLQRPANVSPHTDDGWDIVSAEPQDEIAPPKLARTSSVVVDTNPSVYTPNQHSTESNKHVTAPNKHVTAPNKQSAAPNKHSAGSNKHATAPNKHQQDANQRTVLRGLHIKPPGAAKSNNTQRTVHIACSNPRCKNVMSAVPQSYETRIWYQVRACGSDETRYFCRPRAEQEYILNELETQLTGGRYHKLQQQLRAMSPASENGCY